MPFEITTMTEARVASVTNRVEKHGDDDVPAVSIGLEITAPNTLLDTIDPKLRHALYTAVEGQEDLPGVEPATPVLRCHSFETHALTTVHEGWTLEVDDGIDGTLPMVFGGCKLSKFRVQAKQGGSIVLTFRAGTADVDADKLGKLGMHVGQSIWVTLHAPKAKPDAIDGSVEAFERDYPAGEGDATDLFAQTHGAGGAGDDGDNEDHEPEPAAGPAWPAGPDGRRVGDPLPEPPQEPERGEGWPFPQEGAGASEPPPDETVIELPKRGRRRSGAGARA